MLDKLLVDAASAAGAEIREGFKVEDVLFDDGRVVGISDRSARGDVMTERASVPAFADRMSGARREVRFAGAISPAEFFSPESVGRIMAAAQSTN